MHFLPILATALSLSLLVLGASAQSQEDRLVADLLLNKISRASRIARPVSDAGDNVTVTLGLSLIRIESVTRQKSAELGVWLNMNWEDPRLKWSPADFGGVSSLTLDADLVWLPDIRLFSVMGYTPDKETASRVVLSSSGNVIYVLPARVRSDCLPSDIGSMACGFVLGSWSTSGLQLDLQVSKTAPFDLSTYVADDKWDVVSADATKKEAIYDCCPDIYISIDYKLKLKPKEDLLESVGTQTA